MFELMLENCELAEVIGLTILEDENSVQNYLKNFSKIYEKQKSIIEQINLQLESTNLESERYTYSAGVPFLCPLITQENILKCAKEMKLSNAHRDDAVFAIVYKDQLEFLGHFDGETKDFDVDQIRLGYLIEMDQMRPTKS